MKIPKTPFATCLSGSAKETELRLRNIFQWKKKRPPVVLVVLTLAVLFSCFGLFACVPQEEPDAGIAPTVEPTPTAGQMPDTEPTPTASAEPIVSTKPTPSAEPASREDPLLTEVEYALAVPDFLTEEQQTIYRRANSLYRHAFGAATAGVEYREVLWSNTDTSALPQTLEYNGYTYTRADGPFAQWADFDEAVHSVFTDVFFWNRNGVPIYIEHGGWLYFLDIGRGCGYFYNNNFPDEFRLVSQTDTTIEFMLIGHYSQVWPNEGESTQERNERLERGYEYTYEFPITMVLTEDGWRFDQFYSAQTDEVGPETALKQNDTALAACLSVLRGETDFVYAETGERVRLEQLQQVLYEGRKEANVTPTHFAVADLDADGISEVVVQLSVYSTCEYLILRWQEGEVYAYSRGLRSLMDLKTDGTFGWSSGAFDNGFGRIRFEEYIYTYDGRTFRESHTLERITWCRSDGYDEEGNWLEYFFVNGLHATAQEYSAAVAWQSAKPGAVWYEFTEENINTQFGG